jgi:hypothetical protein
LAEPRNGAVSFGYFGVAVWKPGRQTDQRSGGAVEYRFLTTLDEKKLQTVLSHW